MRPPASLHRSGRVLLALLLAACALRLFLGVTTAWNWDESREWIYTAEHISLAPGRVSVPFRIANHPTGGAIGMHLGQLLLPGTAVGPRLGGIVTGVALVAVTAAMAGALAGPTAAAWAAAFVAFNEYHAVVSATAIEIPYYLAFGMLALYAFARFLESDADRWLYAAAFSLGYAYFCKELAALLGPPMLVALIRRDRLAWLWRARSWIAAGIVLLFVVPDYLTTAEAAPSTALSPTDHLSRITGFGLRYHPAAFYLYDAVRWGITRLGREFFDPSLGGYPPTNLVAGAMLLGGVTWALVVAGLWRTHIGWLLGSVFVLVTGWFTVVETSGGARSLDPIAWAWVDLTLAPAAVFTGAWLARQDGRWRTVTWTAAAVGLALCVGRVGATRLNLEPMNAAACPEHVLATGDWRDVEIRLLRCDACSTSVATVTAVQVLGADRRGRPARPDEAVIVQRDGAAPRLRLRAASAPGETWGGWPQPWTAGEPARRYVITVEPGSASAPATWPRLTNGPLEVDVFVTPRPFTPAYRPVHGCTAPAAP